MIKSKAPKILIVDYGIGNLYSISKAVSRFTDNFSVSEDPGDLTMADAIILPGVGSFKSGVEGLKIRNLIKPIKKFAGENKPVLGICLGAQLMMSKGYEFGEFEGLDIIPGKVVRFQGLEKGTKIPHIGWNKIKISKNASKTEIFKSLGNNPFVYFVHSYVLKPNYPSTVLAITPYGGSEFCSAIKLGNSFGCQFHPEKSGQVGLRIIENFINLAKARPNNTFHNEKKHT